MPKLNAETKEQIKRLDRKSLQDIVIKMASRDKRVYDYLLANYLDREFGEEDLLEETKADFTKYDTKVATIVKRLINIVTKKLHQDYKLDYKDAINRYLQVLHNRSPHNDTVYNLPKAI